MDNEPTCGKGIAGSARLPASLADLMAAMAATLAEHRKAIITSDPAGRDEDDAYAGLIADLQDVSGRLSAVAQRMEDYRTLPMAAHDMGVMTDPATLAPYARFVEIERGLAGMLTVAVGQGEALIRGQAGAGGES
jgi:hypothetical protein